MLHVYCCNDKRQVSVVQLHGGHNRQSNRLSSVVKLTVHEEMMFPSEKVGYRPDPSYP